MGGDSFSQRFHQALSTGRVDLSGMPREALAWVMTERARRGHAQAVLILENEDGAQRMEHALQFFLPDATVLRYPAPDTTPYAAVAPDRKAAMTRAATLHHLVAERPWHFLVLTVRGLMRRVMPREATQSRVLTLSLLQEVDREQLVQRLLQDGYLKVSLTEDAGTFAVRGGIIDVFPAQATQPVRVELDDDLIESMRPFDPEDQRTQSGTPPLEHLPIQPVSDVPQDPQGLEEAVKRLRILCDEQSIPTSQSRALAEDLKSGRNLFGMDGYLPAFVDSMVPVLDYVPESTPLVLFDPVSLARAFGEEWDRAQGQYDQKLQAAEPAFDPPTHYMQEQTLRTRVLSHPLVVAHRLAVMGQAPDSETADDTHEANTASHHVWPWLETPTAPLSHDATDQQILKQELHAERLKKSEEPLAPVVRYVSALTAESRSVVLTSRTTTQGERLVRLLSSYDTAVHPTPIAFQPEALQRNRGRAVLCVGTLEHGFQWPTEGLSVVTETEIFGAKNTRRRSPSKKKSRARDTPFLSNLQELAVGDFVVHREHGVGRYVGLEKKQLGHSRLDELAGKDVAQVEVLVVEYQNGDRLFLPVSRLDQIQRLSGKEGKAPKMDKLGGQSFSKTKKRVEQKVRQMADELLKLYAQRAASSRPALPPPDRTYEEFEATFPYDETPDQKRAIDEVLDDFDRERPMDRVVCGDVGFGKTEVALRAAFRVAIAGKQVALLCPTTVLAQQHHNTFAGRMAPYPLSVKSLSRFVPKEEQRQAIAGLREGKVDVVVGTHRMLSKDVHFKDLGLLIIDEEQRFGVTHKERIKKLRAEVDVLTLSATPIPRTLHMAIGGLRDLSVIATPPVDRRAVRTFVSRWDENVIRDAVHREMARGGQIFFVHNRIEGLYERAQQLRMIVPDARIAVAHGQMTEGALEETMADFVEHRYDVLCATAIVESGLDIPRANTMIIDRADIFGLAQLYQLRGRVGRSRERAYCYLITAPPSSLTDEARYRIEALERFTELGSGFHVASLDMEMRGAGDLLGADQSGTVALVGFDLFTQMLEDAVAELRGEANVHDVDPELSMDTEHFIPDDYVEDVGLRLSLYRRMATASTTQAIDDIAKEMEDRFGPPPQEAVSFIRIMALKPPLRDLRVLACEATPSRVTLHLRQDTPLDPKKVMARVSQSPEDWRLTQDMRLTRRFGTSEHGDGTTLVERVLAELEPLVS